MSGAKGKGCNEHMKQSSIIVALNCSPKTPYKIKNMVVHRFILHFEKEKGLILKSFKA